MGDNSLLGGYLHGLLSYPERIYKGVEVIHPHTQELVAYGAPLQGVMPKEQELVSIIKRELKQQRKVMVYFQNSLFYGYQSENCLDAGRGKHPCEGAEIRGSEGRAGSHQKLG